MSNHDYTGCQEPACALCDAYDEGYSACVGLRYAMGGGTPAPPPTPKHGRCAVCEREGVVIEVVCSRCWG